MADVTDLVAALSPTRRDLLLRRLNQKRRALPEPAVGRRSRTADAVPLSFAQQRLWVLDQLEPDNPVWNIYLGARLGGPLNVPALAQSVAEIVRRHESLRTTFAYMDGRPVQVRTGAQSPPPLPLVRLEHLPESLRAEVAQRVAGAESRRTFDLTRGSLLRVTLLRLGSDDHVALLTMHHIISDGWSLGIFMSELSALYEAYVAGRPSQLEELPIQYADFTLWQRDWMQGEVLAQQLDYWRRQLDGANAYMELTPDRPRPAVRTYVGAMQSLTVAASRTEALREIGRQEGATLFMTLLAAFVILLHYHTGREDVLVGTDIANRNRREIEGLIGFFVNHPVLRVDASGNPTFRALLGRVREVALGAYEHQDVPFEKLVEATRAPRVPGRTPLFQVLFVLQNSPLPVRGLPGLEVSPWQVHNGSTKFDLFVSAAETEQGLTFTLEYSTEVFTRRRIERLLKHYDILLAAAEAPEATLDAFDALVSAAERGDQAASEQELAESNRRKLHQARRHGVKFGDRV
jgi:hypothetical protein